MTARSSLAILFAFTCAATAIAAPVHLSVDTDKGREFGAGFSVARADECFVLVPHHVVAWAKPDGIRVTDTDGDTGIATIVKAVEQFDAALLRMPDGAIDCAADWVASAASTAAIEEAEFLVATKADQSGRIRKTRLFATTVASEFMELEPFGTSDHLGEGDSGSVLYAGDVLVGMVQQIDTRTGRVTAITHTQLHGLFGADLLGKTERVIALVPFQLRGREDPYATIAARQFLGAETKLRVVDAVFDRRTQQPLIPPGSDYLLSGRIIDLSLEQVPNPDYEPEHQREAGFTRKLFDAMFNKNRTDRYFVVVNVDVEIDVLDVAAGSTVRNLERRRIDAGTGQINQREVEKTAVSTAVRDALELTLEKYPLPRG